jgi:predicted DNA-binding protein (MmcQ/YjbR family)
MTLHSAKAFARFVASLPAATMSEQWEAHVAKVGGKVFALLGEDSGAITFKVTEIAFEGLTATEGIGQAPYFAKRAWVSVEKGAALSDADLKAYIAASHRMVADRLTRKAKAELGLMEIQPQKP